MCTPDHLSGKRVARRWAVSHRTLERWRWMGCGPRYLKIGGRVVYRLADIEAYEAAQLRNATNTAPATALRPRGPA